MCRTPRIAKSTSRANLITLTFRSYWWEVASLVQRTILLDWLLLIGKKKLFLRLLAGLSISVAYLFALLLCQPYKRKLDGRLASGGQLLVVGLFIGGILVNPIRELLLEHQLPAILISLLTPSFLCRFAQKVFLQNAIIQDPQGSAAFALLVLGLETPDEAVFIMITIVLFFFVCFIGAVSSESYAHYHRRKLESKWSLCSIEPPQVKAWRTRGAFACFISHYKMGEPRGDPRFFAQLVQTLPDLLCIPCSPQTTSTSMERPLHLLYLRRSSLPVQPSPVDIVLPFPSKK